MTEFDMDSYREAVGVCRGAYSSGRRVIYTRDDRLVEKLGFLTWYDRDDGRKFAVESDSGQKKEERDLEMSPSAVAGIIDSVSVVHDNKIVLKLLPPKVSQSLLSWLTEHGVEAQLIKGKKTNKVVVYGRVELGKLNDLLDFDDYIKSAELDEVSA